MKPRPISAFTLVELMVTLAIVSILSVLIFRGAKQWIERGRTVACVGNLRSLGNALQLYLGDHHQMLPPLAAARESLEEEIPTIDSVLVDYIDSPKILTCPSDTSLAKTTGTSYYWNSALSGQSLASLNFLSFVEDATRIPLIFDKEGWHKSSQNRVNFLYADGHVAQSLTLFTSP